MVFLAAGVLLFSQTLFAVTYECTVGNGYDSVFVVMDKPAMEAEQGVLLKNVKGTASFEAAPEIVQLNGRPSSVMTLSEMRTDPREHRIFQFTNQSPVDWASIPQKDCYFTDYRVNLIFYRTEVPTSFWGSRWLWPHYKVREGEESKCKIPKLKPVGPPADLNCEEVRLVVTKEQAD